MLVFGCLFTINLHFFWMLSLPELQAHHIRPPNSCPGPLLNLLAVPAAAGC
jgi:hypothetical protein